MVIRVSRNELFPITVSLIDYNTDDLVSGGTVFYDVRDSNDNALSPPISGTLIESSIEQGLYKKEISISDAGSYTCYATCSGFLAGTEEIIVNPEDIYELIKQNRHYNTSVEDVPRTSYIPNASQAARNVPRNKTDYIITKIKQDSDSDWSTTTVSGIVYAWYRSTSDEFPYLMGASDGTVVSGTEIQEEEATATTFIALTDTPSTYSGSVGQFLITTASGVEFTELTGAFDIDLEIDLNLNNLEYDGIVSNYTVGTTVTFGDLLYLDSDDKYKLSDNTGNYYMPSEAIALESKSDGETCLLLKYGAIRNDNWSLSKGVVYSSTSGTLTQTPTTTEGYFRQTIGYTVNSGTLFFNPSTDFTAYSTVFSGTEVYADDVYASTYHSMSPLVIQVGDDTVMSSTSQSTGVTFSGSVNTPLLNVGANNDIQIERDGLNNDLKFTFGYDTYIKGYYGGSYYPAIGVVGPTRTAAGTMTFTGQPNIGGTFLILSDTFTFISASGIPGTREINIGATVDDTVNNTSSEINSNFGGSITAIPDTDSDSIRVEATGWPGVVGNLASFSEDADNLAMDDTGALYGTVFGNETGAVELYAGNKVALSTMYDSERNLGMILVPGRILVDPGNAQNPGFGFIHKSNVGITSTVFGCFTHVFDGNAIYSHTDQGIHIFPNGSAQFPTIAFNRENNTDGDTGFYSVAPNTLGITTSGTLRLSVNEDGSLSVSGTDDYEDLVTDDDVIPNKKYVDDYVSTAVGEKTFINLTDTPSNYSDGKYLISTTTGIDWVSTTSGVYPHDHDERYYTESEIDALLTSFSGSLIYDVTPNTIEVNPDAPEIVGNRYQTWADADTYVQSQSPASDNRWSIKITGNNSEDIILRDFVTIQGNGSTRLTGAVDSVATEFSPTEKAYVEGCILTNLSIVGNYRGFLRRCNIEGGSTTAGSLHFHECYLIGGSLAIQNGSDMQDCNVVGGSYTAGSNEWHVLSCQITEYFNQVTFTGSFFIEACYMFNTIDMFQTGNIRIANCLERNTSQAVTTGLTVDIYNSHMGGWGATTGTLNTYNCTGSFSGAGWTNYGAVYDGTYSGLVASEMQGAVNALNDLVSTVPPNVIEVDPDAPEVVGHRYTTWSGADAYITANGSPDHLNEWGIKITGTNNEDIVLRDWIEIIGNGQTRLTGTLKTRVTSINYERPASRFIGCNISDFVQDSNGYVFAAKESFIEEADFTAAPSTAIRLNNCQVKNIDSTGEIVGVGYARYAWNTQFYGTYAMGERWVLYGCDFKGGYPASIENGGYFYNCTIDRAGSQLALFGPSGAAYCYNTAFSSVTINCDSNQVELNNCSLHNCTVSGTPMSLKTRNIILTGSSTITASNWTHEGNFYDNSSSGLSAENDQDAIDELALSIGAGSFKTKLIQVNENATELEGVRYTTWSGADAYIQTQSPDESNRWTIQILGDNSENITVRDDVSIKGVGNNILSGQVIFETTLNYTNIEQWQTTVSDCILEDIRCTNVDSFISIERCRIHGCNMTTSYSMIIADCDIKSGTFYTRSGSNINDCRIMPFPYSSHSVVFRQAASSGEYYFTGIVGQWFDVECGARFFNSRIAQPTLATDEIYYIFNSVLNISITLDSAGKIYIYDSSQTPNASHTINAASGLVHTYNSSTVRVTGDGWVNFGDKYDNRGSGLSAEYVQDAIDEIESDKLKLDSDISGSTAYDGVTINHAVGETVVFSDLVHLSFSDGEYKKSDNTISSKMPAVGMALESKGDGEDCEILKYGKVKNSSWNWQDGLIYASVAGTLTQVEPTTSGTEAQVIGYAMSSGTIFFNPNYETRVI